MSSFKESGYTFDCARLRILPVWQTLQEYVQTSKALPHTCSWLSSACCCFLQGQTTVGPDQRRMSFPAVPPTGESVSAANWEQQIEHNPHCRMLFSIVHRVLSSCDHLLLLSNNSACVETPESSLLSVVKTDMHCGRWSLQSVSNSFKTVRFLSAKFGSCMAANLSCFLSVCRKEHIFNSWGSSHLFFLYFYSGWRLKRWQAAVALTLTAEDKCVVDWHSKKRNEMSRDNPKEVRENLFSEVSHHSTRGDYSTRGDDFKGGGDYSKITED